MEVELKTLSEKGLLHMGVVTAPVCNMERLAIRLAFSFDRDFAQYGFTVLPVL
jgi:hypothetical protein